MRFVMAADFQELNPVRSPSWRAERAVYLAERLPQPFRLGREDDFYVRSLWRYLTELREAGDDHKQRSSVRHEFSTVYQAQQLRFNQDHLRRSILEARLLTEESFATIAERYGVEAALIEHYEQLFFAVRDRLESRDWIHKVIGAPSLVCGNDESRDCLERRRGVLYRIIAYRGGSTALDAATNGMRSVSNADDSDLAEYFGAEFRESLERKTVVGAGGMTLDQRNTMRLIKLAIEGRY
jgi:hypothetical protein